MADQSCLICRETASITSLIPIEDGCQFDCPRCGNFILAFADQKYFQNLDDRNQLPYLSAYIRQNSLDGRPVRVVSESWQEMARTHAFVPVLVKTQKLLQLAANRSDYPGSGIRIRQNDFPLVDAKGVSELEFLVDHLDQIGYLKKQPKDADQSIKCYVTVHGWTKLQEHNTSGIPGKCFVAMSFDPALEEAWKKGIFPALHDDCKLYPIRMKELQHNENICDKMIAEIRLSQFMVADFTLHRGGVYFEAGFMLGLGRHVVWTCKEDDLKNAHFDTNHYNHICWKTPEDLREQLCDRVKATILKPNS